jgi:hypothetical protein
MMHYDSEHFHECFAAGAQLPLGSNLIFDFHHQAGNAFFVQHGFHVRVVKGVRIAKFQEEEYDALGLVFAHLFNQVVAAVIEPRMLGRANDPVQIALGKRLNRVAGFITRPSK